MDRRALQNDDEETQKLILDGRQSTMWTALPCIVQEVDFESMTLTAQPAIQGSITNQNNVTQFVNLPLLLDVPIVFPSAGSFTITFPIAAGDEVLVVFASRCIDSWWQSSGIGMPIETRMHDLSDGFAIPGPRSVPRVVGSISTTALQIRNDAGTSYIELSADGKAKIVASEIDFTGNLKVTGNISATGEVTGNSATTPIPLTTHLHIGVTTGVNNTGTPIS